MTGETFVEKKHSGLGVSSFIISVVIAILMFLLFAVAGVMETSTPGGMDEESIGAMLVGLGLFAFLFVDLLAIGLGVAGLFQTSRKKVFPILGVAVAAGTVVLTIFLVILGLMA